MGLSEEEKQESLQRARNDGFFGKKKQPRDFSEIAAYCLVFFNPMSGLQIAFHLNDAFPLPNNPNFNVEKCEERFYALVESTQISTELVLYCIKHCKNKLPFLSEQIGKQYLDNIDFFLRFWKKESYHTKSNLHTVGRD